MSPPREDEPSEQSPLLGEQNGSANGHIDSEQQQTADSHADGAEEVVLADEPPTSKLILIMFACMLGVFFAALGNQFASSLRLIEANVIRYKYCSYTHRAYILRVRLSISPILARHRLPHRQLLLPTTLRQTNRHLRPTQRPHLQQHLLRRRHPDLRPRSQRPHHHLRPRRRWHRWRRPHLHYHLRDL